MPVREKLVRNALDRGIRPRDGGKRIRFLEIGRSFTRKVASEREKAKRFRHENARRTCGQDTVREKEFEGKEKYSD